MDLGCLELNKMSRIVKIKKATLGISKVIWRILYVRPKNIIDLLAHYNKWCKHESYFPEDVKKSQFRIFIDQLHEIVRYGSANEFYFPYGFDVKSQEQMKEYLHYTPFMQLRDKHNIKLHSATAVLRNKQLFGMFTEYYGIKSAENLAISTSDGLFDLIKKKYVSVSDFFHDLMVSDLFMKPVDGECGNGIYHVSINNGSIIANGRETTFAEMAEILLSASYLIQATVIQHDKLKLLHPQSLNTIRLVTIKNPKNGRPEVFPSILRIGTGDAIVDNTSQGGLAVGIHLDNGRLREFGYYKPAYGTKVAIHPDSKIRFSEFTIPFFEECKRQAIFLHSRLPDIHSIGWDIAIGSEGPIFIEGNDNWEINGPQICNGGLKNKFKELL